MQVASVSTLSVLQPLTHRRRSLSHYMFVTPPADSAVEQSDVVSCEVSNSRFIVIHGPNSGAVEGGRGSVLGCRTGLKSLQ